MRKLIAASLFIVLLFLVPVLAGAAISRLYASLTVPTGGTIVDSNQTASACLGASSVGQYVYNTNCISTLTAGQNISIGSGATPTIGFTGTLPITNGGTNISSVTSGDCVRAASSTAFGMAAGDCVTSVTASGNIASSGGTTPNITLTGIVPIANGGTNISSVTSGDCVRAASSTALGMAAADCVTSVTGSGNIASSGGTTPNITLTGIVPIANGGTNCSTQCWVDLTTAQTVAGSKDFTSPLEVVPDGSGNILFTKGTGASGYLNVGTNSSWVLSGVSCSLLYLFNNNTSKYVECLDGNGNESITGAITTPELISNQSRGSMFEEWPCVSTSTCSFYSGGTVAGTSGEVLDMYDSSTSTSLFALDHNGNEGVAGNFFAGSSEKVKRNIQSLNFDPLSVIDSTDWIQFCYKIDHSCHSGEEGSQTVGFIAEKTSAVLAGPHHNRVNPVTLGSVDGAAIKELSAEVSRLQAIVAALCANARDQAAVACAAQ